MKVIFLTAATSRSAGGLFFTITSYTKALKFLGVDVMVVGFDDEYSKEDRHSFGNVEVITYDISKLPVLSTLGYSSDLLTILEKIKPDIIHLQGLWMYHSWATLKYRKKHPKVKVIIEPHGMLDSWALHNSSWKKKVAGHLYEYENLRKADLLHALCLSEFESIRKCGLTNPIEIIPNGVDIPPCKHKQIHNSKSLVFIGRIHPKKGLKHLIEAISIIKNTTPELLHAWHIKIAGWDQLNHLSELKVISKTLGVDNYFEFVGPVFGDKKNELLWSSDAFILPSYSEGLPMSILEAWSYGLPVLMTDFCNLPEGFSTGSSLRIEPDAKNIASVLAGIFKMSENELKVIGDKAYSLVSSRFTWPIIAKKTIEIYYRIM